MCLYTKCVWHFVWKSVLDLVSCRKATNSFMYFGEIANRCIKGHILWHIAQVFGISISIISKLISALMMKPEVYLNLRKPKETAIPKEMTYRQIARSSICLTFIGFRRCTIIHINIDSLRVHRSVRPSLYPFYSLNCLHILSNVFRSTARQPTSEVGSIRCGSSKIRSSKISKFQPYHKHQVFWFFDHLHNHSSPET